MSNSKDCAVEIAQAVEDSTEKKKNRKNKIWKKWIFSKKKVSIFSNGAVVSWLHLIKKLICNVIKSLGFV